jgi:D-glycero-D-manno-heptose 1,7-bisphosphate phosphatase
MGVGAMKGDLRRAVFLDRDGVLNRAIVKEGKPRPPHSPDELEIPGDVLPALQSLKANGFVLICVTNQPDVARGKQRREVVEAINATLLKALPLHEINVCYHDDQDGCECRKPQPGLLLAAVMKYLIDLSSSFMVGDRWRDIEAGHRAGCRTILIDYGYPENWVGQPPHCKASSLSEAANWILQQLDSTGER